MVEQVILLSGAPATGKDTITTKLVKMYPQQYIHFMKHRGCDETRSNNQYINVSKQQFKEMIEKNDFLQYHLRYNRYYGISHKMLQNNLALGLTPIIHTGKLENMKEIEREKQYQTTKFLLWVTEEIATARLYERHRSNKEEINERLLAYQEEMVELRQSSKEEIFDVIIENNNIDQSVMMIHQYMNGQLDNAVIEKEKGNFYSYLERNY